MKTYDTVESRYSHATIVQLFYQGYTIKQLTAQVASGDRVPKRIAQECVELVVYNYLMAQKKQG